MDIRNEENKFDIDEAKLQHYILMKCMEREERMAEAALDCGADFSDIQRFKAVEGERTNNFRIMQRIAGSVSKIKKDGDKNASIISADLVRAVEELINVVKG